MQTKNDSTGARTVHDHRFRVPLRARTSIRAVGTVVRHRQFARALVATIIAAWPVAPLNAEDAIYSAERVKAAFLYHFATYVNWPESATANSEFTIAVLGANAVATELEQFLPGRTIQGRPMSIHRLRSIDDLDSEEVLFIGTDKNTRLADYLDEIESRSVLVVTDVPEGLRQGAMINFRVVDSRVRFEISLRSAEDVGLELSSRLLSAAMFVDTAGAIVDISSNAVATSSYNGAATR